VGSSKGELCGIILFWLARNANSAIIRQQRTSGPCRTGWN
jgi:hypothetical protein